MKKLDRFRDKFIKHAQIAKQKPDNFGYELPPEIILERDEMISSGEYSINQIKAFTLANGAEFKIENMLIPLFDLQKISEMINEALKLDPLCLDAYRVLIRMMMYSPQIDGDTSICLYREVMYTFRKLFFNELLYAHQGECSKILRLRSYLRLLRSIWSVSMLSEKPDVAVFALEEALKSDNHDIFQLRYLLILSYLKIIGRNQRTYMSNIERNFDDLNALLNASLPYSDGPLFDENDDHIVLRWLRMIVAFRENDMEKFKQLAKEEEIKNPQMIKLLFAEKKSMINDDSENRKLYEPMNITLIEWPQFMIALHNYLRKVDEDFNSKLMKMAPSYTDDIFRDFKAQMYKMGNDFLERGRNALRNNQISKALTLFTMSKRYFVETMKPSQRWYTNAPFAIVSNRGACAAKHSYWLLSLHDARFTLLLQPDHIRTYERLPLIVSAFDSQDLKQELLNLSNIVKVKPGERSRQEWQEIANRAIGLSSLIVIICSRLGKLTDEIRNEAIALGIQDMYIPCTLTPDIMDPLPWLSEKDMETL